MATIKYKVIPIQQYVSDFESQLNDYGAVSSGSYELVGVYNNVAVLMSGSSGINVTGSVILPTGVVSSSAQLPAGIISSSTQLPTGTVSSSTQINTGSFTGSFIGLHTSSLSSGVGFLGTSSWAQSSSVAISASWAPGVISSSFATTSSYALSASFATTTSSYAVTASYVPLPFGQWFSVLTQTGSANSASVFTYESQSFTNGFSLVSGSRITANRTGYYNFQFSAQLLNTANETIDYDMWFRQNGVDDTWSNTRYEVVKAPGSLGFSVASLNFFTLMTSGSYLELVWSANSANASIYAAPSASGPIRPGIPSVIMNVHAIGTPT